MQLVLASILSLSPRACVLVCVKMKLWEKERLPVVENGDLFLLTLLDFEMTVVDTGSGSILRPLGLPHCRGTLVQAASAGTSFRPRRIQFHIHQKSCLGDSNKLQINALTVKCKKKKINK